MEKKEFNKKVKKLFKEHEKFIKTKNEKTEETRGIFWRHKNPILTDGHTPVFWRYDLNYETNPFCMERLGINTILNSGAIKLGDKYILVARIEGLDRKSFFAVAESPNGIDNFKFRDYPIQIPETDDPDIDTY